MKNLLITLRKKIQGPIISVLNQVLIVVVALVVMSIVVALCGYKASDVVMGLGQSIGKQYGSSIRWATPLILLGLAAAVAFKGGVWNIGIDGQFYIGAFAATLTGLTIAKSIPAPFSIIIACGAATFAGALWSLIPALLRVKLGASELVTGVLLNQVAIFLVDFFLFGPFHLTSSAYQTAELPESFWLAHIIPNSSANTGFYIALGLAILFYFIFTRTTFGYELRVMGTNMLFGQFGGMNLPSVFMKSFIISGAISGLAGAIEILGVQHLFAGLFNPGLGMEGIAVSLLAQNNPLGVVISGLFFGALRNSSIILQVSTDVPRAMIQVVEGMIILAISAKAGLSFIKQRKNKRKVSDKLSESETVKCDTNPIARDGEKKV